MAPGSAASIRPAPSPTNSICPSGLPDPSSASNAIAEFAPATSADRLTVILRPRNVRSCRHDPQVAGRAFREARPVPDQELCNGQLDNALLHVLRAAPQPSQAGRAVAFLHPLRDQGLHVGLREPLARGQAVVGEHSSKPGPVIGPNEGLADREGDVRVRRDRPCGRQAVRPTGRIQPAGEAAEQELGGVAVVVLELLPEGRIQTQHVLESAVVVVGRHPPALLHCLCREDERRQEREDGGRVKPARSSPGLQPRRMKTEHRAGLRRQRERLPNYLPETLLGARASVPDACRDRCDVVLVQIQIDGPVRVRRTEGDVGDGGVPCGVLVRVR